MELRLTMKMCVAHTEFVRTKPREDEVVTVTVTGIAMGRLFSIATVTKDGGGRNVVMTPIQSNVTDILMNILTPAQVTGNAKKTIGVDVIVDGVDQDVQYTENRQSASDFTHGSLLSAQDTESAFTRTFAYAMKMITTPTPKHVNAGKTTKDVVIT